MKAAVAAGDSIDTQNINGWSAAMFAVLNGDLGGLKTCTELGINLNLQTTTGVTALMMAASQNDKEMVEVRIQLFWKYFQKGTSINYIFYCHFFDHFHFIIMFNASCKWYSLLSLHRHFLREMPAH
jgi:hypothetical protein